MAESRGSVTSTDGYGNLISCGAAGGTTVTGQQGVFVLSCGDHSGSVTSDQGDAVLVAIGNSRPSVTAGGSASLLVTGKATGVDVNGSEQVNGPAEGDLEGKVTGGSDVVLRSGGTLNGTKVSAGKDLQVRASGDVVGSYTAARDASVVTHGTFNGSVTASRDVGTRDFCSQRPGVWAAGDIQGVIQADRNVGQASEPAYLFDFEQEDEGPYEAPSAIRSYGSIDAMVTALNTTGSAEGGYVGPVTANGNIEGMIFADSEIEALQSGGLITAMALAPEVGPGGSHHDVGGRFGRLVVLLAGCLGRGLGQLGRDHIRRRVIAGLGNRPEQRAVAGRFGRRPCAFGHPRFA